MDPRFVTVLLSLMCLLFASARATAAELAYDNGKLSVPRLSKKEMRKLHQQAESLTTGVIPDDAKIGIWFDGNVEEALSSDKFNQPGWLVRVDRIFVGREQISGRRIKIRSATTKLGGCKLRVGTEYRIFAVNLKQLYSGEPDDPYAWRGSVVPLSQLKHHKTI